MIVKREKFIADFNEYIDKKFRNELPEEDFEDSMLDLALDIIKEHSGEIKSTLKHP